LNSLVLLRHGRTVGNEKHWYYGATDLPLSEGGRTELLEKVRAGVYPALGGRRLIVTPLRRTQESAAILYPGAPFEVWPALREVDCGAFECRSYEEMKDEPDYQRWLADGWYTTAPPGGESLAAAETRMRAALTELLALPGDAALVCHGGTIIIFMQALFPEVEKTQYEWQPEPGCGWRVDLRAHSFTPIG
jgi:alpha-ribazole phosphatase